MTLHTASPADSAQQVLVPLAAWSSIWPYAEGDYAISGGSVWLAVDPVLGVAPAAAAWTEVVGGGGGGGLPAGLIYVSPCFTVGTTTDNQAEVCGSATGDSVAISAVGSDAEVALHFVSKTVPSNTSMTLGNNALGDFGIFLSAPSTVWVSTMDKGMNIEPGMHVGTGHTLSLSGGEPDGVTANGGQITMFGTTGLGTGRGGHIQIGAGGGDVALGTGGTLFLTAGDAATPGEVSITTGNSGVGPLSVTADASSFSGSVSIGTRTGSSAATYACFTASGQLVESAIPCV